MQRLFSWACPAVLSVVVRPVLYHSNICFPDFTLLPLVVAVFHNGLNVVLYQIGVVFFTAVLGYLLQDQLPSKVGQWFTEFTKKSLLWDSWVVPQFYRTISLFVFKDKKSQFPLKWQSVHSSAYVDPTPKKELSQTAFCALGSASR